MNESVFSEVIPELLLSHFNHLSEGSGISVDVIRDTAKKLNPEIDIFEISCRTGEGMEDWYSWLRDKVKSPRSESGL